MFIDLEHGICILKRTLLCKCGEFADERSANYEGHLYIALTPEQKTNKKIIKEYFFNHKRIVYQQKRQITSHLEF